MHTKEREILIAIIAGWKELVEKHPSHQWLVDKLADAYQQKGDIDSEIIFARNSLRNAHQFGGWLTSLQIRIDEREISIARSQVGRI